MRSIQILTFQVQEEKRNDLQTASASRKSWDAYDPTLISEGLFASANIFSCLKLIALFTVNPHLGPLQISLGRMVIDIMKFLFIALLVCFSYSCGVNQLYWYYAEVRSRDCNECEAKHFQKQNSGLADVSNQISDCHGLCDRSIAKYICCICIVYLLHF